MPELEKPFTVGCTSIAQLEPTTVNIIIHHPQCFNQNVKVKIPIDANLYIKLLKLVSTAKYRTWLPLRFTINEKGVAFDVAPFKTKEQEANP